MTKPPTIERKIVFYSLTDDSNIYEVHVYRFLLILYEIHVVNSGFISLFE